MGVFGHFVRHQLTENIFERRIFENPPESQAS